MRTEVSETMINARSVSAYLVKLSFLFSSRIGLERFTGLSDDSIAKCELLDHFINKFYFCRRSSNFGRSDEQLHDAKLLLPFACCDALPPGACDRRP